MRWQLSTHEETDPERLTVAAKVARLSPGPPSLLPSPRQTEPLALFPLCCVFVVAHALLWLCRLSSCTGLQRLQGVMAQ